MKYIITEAQLSEIVRNTINKVLLPESKQDDLAKEYLRNKMINRDVVNLLQRCLSIVRPDRQAPRKVKSQHALSLNNRS